MIGLAPPGRARSWQIAAALTAVHQAFPTDKAGGRVWLRRHRGKDGT